ncbi:hypothetical protein BD309DRAFT_944917 [Dichomitus squalens]|nr:hypothetical protein BD309DRAFT_944917 [Dichomitus squalens]
MSTVLHGTRIDAIAQQIHASIRGKCASRTSARPIPHELGPASRSPRSGQLPRRPTESEHDRRAPSREVRCSLPIASLIPPLRPWCGVGAHADFTRGSPGPCGGRMRGRCPFRVVVHSATPGIVMWAWFRSVYVPLMHALGCPLLNVKDVAAGCHLAAMMIDALLL